MHHAEINLFLFKLTGYTEHKTASNTFPEFMSNSYNMWLLRYVNTVSILHIAEYSPQAFFSVTLNVW